MIDAFVHADGFTHLLALLVLLSRIGDVVSTRLVSPTLLVVAIYGSLFVVRLFRRVGR